jgi:hypothetical protein
MFSIINSEVLVLSVNIQDYFIKHQIFAVD